MTTPSDDEHGLEQRAEASRARLLDTISALERRGAKLVATAHELKSLAALVIDGVAVIGVLTSLFSLIHAATRSASASLRPEPRGTGALSKLAVFALFAGVAYAARRQVGSRKRHNPVSFPPSRLRAVP